MPRLTHFRQHLFYPNQNLIFAVGFCETQPAQGDIRAVSVWSGAFIASLKAKAGLYLSPHVASSALCPSAFPMPLRCAENQRTPYSQVSRIYFTHFSSSKPSRRWVQATPPSILSGSLSYALGRLRQLRADVIHGTGAERLYVFGAVSAGRSWDVYVAYEVDPSESELKCVSDSKCNIIVHHYVLK